MKNIKISKSKNVVMEAKTNIQQNRRLQTMCTFQKQICPADYVTKETKQTGYKSPNEINRCSAAFSPATKSIIMEDMTMYTYENKEQINVKKQKTIQKKKSGLNYNVISNQTKNGTDSHLNFNDEKKYYGVSSGIVQREAEIDIGTLVKVEIDKKIYTGIVIQTLHWDKYVIRRINSCDISVVHKSCLVPLYSSEKHAQSTFDSIMEHGLLSPKDMDDKDIKEAVTTTDAIEEKYVKTTTLKVNMFKINQKINKIVIHLLTEIGTGAIPVGVEDSSTRDLYSIFNFDINLLVEEAKKQAKLQVEANTLFDSNSMSLKDRNSITNVYTEANMYKLYIERVKPLLTYIFEERLRRTMLTITASKKEDLGEIDKKLVPDIENPVNSGVIHEHDVKSITADRFCYAFIPQGLVDKKNNHNVKIVKFIKRRVTFSHQFFFPNLKCAQQFELYLRVPDYENSVYKALVELKRIYGEDASFMSNIVRL